MVGENFETVLNIIPGGFNHPAQPLIEITPDEAPTSPGVKSVMVKIMDVECAQGADCWSDFEEAGSTQVQVEVWEPKYKYVTVDDGVTLGLYPPNICPGYGLATMGFHGYSGYNDYNGTFIGDHQKATGVQITTAGGGKIYGEDALGGVGVTIIIRYSNYKDGVKQGETALSPCPYGAYLNQDDYCWHSQNTNSFTCSSEVSASFSAGFNLHTGAGTCAYSPVEDWNMVLPTEHICGACP